VELDTEVAAVSKVVLYLFGEIVEGYYDFCDARARQMLDDVLGDRLPKNGNKRIGAVLG